MSKADPTGDSNELRRQAEAEYEHRCAQVDPQQSKVNLNSLVRELEIHQIELEMGKENIQQAWAEAEARSERYTELYDFAPIGYFILSGDASIIQANLSGANLLGVERVQLAGRWFGQFVLEGYVPEFSKFIEQAFKSDARQTCEVMLRIEGREHFWVQIEAASALERQECRTVVIDIQPRKLEEMRLQTLSMRDAVTGLYNHGYFMESMERLERGRHFPISILMASVDHLKTTDDQEDPIAGDDMLKRVAQVLGDAFRIEDVIARTGGDEFAVLLPDTNEKSAEIALLRLYTVLQDHNKDYFTNEPLRLSIGISTAAEYGSSLVETLNDADAKMRLQK